MFFVLLLGISSLLVAGAAAYFSVLGIATLFAGSYYQVMVMAGSLEFGKLIAASFLHRYWKQTSWWLKAYMSIAVITLMAVTSIGIFGYLSAAYQVNSAKFEQIDSNIKLIEGQKQLLIQEIESNNERVKILNEIRKTQEQRVQDAGNYKLPREQAYAAIEKANTELQTLTVRNQELQEEQFKKDSEISELKQETAKAKDIGTFKFVADYINKPVDTIVIWFVFCLMFVFDPLAVSLVIAFNTAILNREKKNLKKAEPNLQKESDDLAASEQPTNQPSTLQADKVARGQSVGYQLPK